MKIIAYKFTKKLKISVFSRNCGKKIEQKLFFVTNTSYVYSVIQVSLIFFLCLFGDIISL